MHLALAVFPVSLVALLVGSATASLQRSAAPVPTSVRGTVFDSIARGPLVGAAVQFSGTGEPVAGRLYGAITDSLGRFELPHVVPGTYVAGFFHPALDSLGFAIGPRSIVIRGSNQVVSLATPSVPTIARTLCPDGTFGDSLGMLVGFVRATGSGAPLRGATVTAGWGETIIQGNAIRQREPEVSATADSAGWFGMCALPTDVPLMVRAASAADTSGYVEVTLGQSGLQHQSFHVGGAQPITMDVADSTAPASGQPALGIRRGEARATGVVRDAESNPVSSARVLVWGAGTQDTTNDRGAFALDGLPGGTHTLEVRAIGFTPVRTVVHLAPAQPATVHVALAERVVALPGVTVRGELVYFDQLKEFERRRQGAIGRFVTSAEIDQRSSGGSAVTLLQGLPGVDVVFAPGVGYIAIMKGHQGAPCTPLMYLDGRKAYLSAAELGNLYTAGDIAAVEVYPRISLIPLEFQEMAPSCGVVAFWTRPPSVRMKERR